MVSFTGTVKLLDFGVVHTAKTNASAGLVVGKYRYMAPERLDGSPGAGSSDLYSLGVILYEFLSGIQPFKGVDEVSMLRAILAGAQPLLAVAPHVDPRLAGIVDHAIARDVLQRYSVAARLGRHLRRYLSATDPNGLHRSLANVLAPLFANADDLPSHLRGASAAPSDLPPRGRTNAGSSGTFPSRDTDSSIEIVLEDLDSTVLPDSSIQCQASGAVERTKLSESPPADPNDTSAEDVLARIRQTVQRDTPPVQRADIFTDFLSPATHAAASTPPRRASEPSLAPQSPRSVFDALAGDVSDGGSFALPLSSSSVRAADSLSSDAFSIASRDLRDSMTPSAPDAFATLRRSSARIESSERSFVETAPSSRPGWSPADWGHSSDNVEIVPAASSQTDAAKHFENGLAALREKNYESAIRQWEMAVELEKENRVYQINLKRLKAKFG
jgi:serine/threonine protein kinase